MKKDRFLLCYDCGETFRFPVAERIYYKRRRYQEPCRCRSCRAIRRQEASLEQRSIRRRTMKHSDAERT